MKKLIWIPLAIIILAAGGYYIYFEIYPTRERDSWDLVPSNALAVYESDQVIRVWNRINQLNFVKNLSSVEAFRDLESRVLLLDSLAGKQGKLDQVLTGKTFLASVHIVSTDAFGYLLFLPLEHPASKELLGSILKEAQTNSESRVYQGFAIEEIDLGESRMFAYSMIQDFLVGSFTPVLVEDAIRMASQGDVGFKQQNQSIMSLAKLENDQGNLYVNTRKLDQMLAVMGLPDGLPQLGQSSFLDVSVQDDRSLFTGFTTTEEGDNTEFLNLFNQVAPAEMQMADLIPERTSHLLHLTFKDPQRFRSNLASYLEINDPTQIRQRDSLSSEMQIDVNQTLEWLGTEIGFATLESINPQRPDRLLLLQSRDPASSLNQLNRMAENINQQIEDSLYRETFGQVPITQLYLKDFPRLILGPQFYGFETCFFAPVEDYVVFGNSIESLKILLTDISLENTWGKSVSKSNYLESILKEANLSYIVDTRNRWDDWMNQLNPAWSEFFQDNRTALRAYDQLALQFGFIDDKFYTSLDVHYSASPVEAGSSSRFNIAQDVESDTTVITKPYVFRSHLDRNFETIIQDARNRLVFLSSEGAVLWTRNLGAPLVGPVFQLDFYQNGKYQYLLAAGNTLHAFDRNGDYLEHYPVELDSSIVIDQINLIDYDNSGSYRVLISDPMGLIYMYDKEGENLEGWRGREMGSPLSSAPYHIRVRNRDCLVFGWQNGKVVITNRRGENFKGFPLEFDSPIQNPLFVQVGSSFSNTIFSTITEDGEMVRFNLNGEVTSRVQFYKPSKEVVFTLVPDALGRNFVIARQEANRLSILDRRGELIFEKDYLTARQMIVQFYSFGSDGQFYAVTDQEQEFTYLYDWEGNLINYEPIESGFRIGLLKRGRSDYQVYGSYADRMRVYEFSR